MLPTFEDYCLLIANLPDQFPSIRSSTLTAYRIGPFAAEAVPTLITSTFLLISSGIVFPRPNFPLHAPISPH